MTDRINHRGPAWLEEDISADARLDRILATMRTYLREQIIRDLQRTIGDCLPEEFGRRKKRILSDYAKEAERRGVDFDAFFNEQNRSVTFKDAVEIADMFESFFFQTFRPISKVRPSR